MVFFSKYLLSKCVWWLICTWIYFLGFEFRLTTWSWTFMSNYFVINNLSTNNNELLKFENIEWCLATTLENG
jgi:hypothetical protein